jgi:hypothetical protein
VSKKQVLCVFQSGQQGGICLRTKHSRSIIRRSQGSETCWSTTLEKGPVRVPAIRPVLASPMPNFAAVMATPGGHGRSNFWNLCFAMHLYVCMYCYARLHTLRTSLQYSKGIPVTKRTDPGPPQPENDRTARDPITLNLRNDSEEYILPAH